MDDMTQTGTTLDRVAEAAARLLDAATSQEPISNFFQATQAIGTPPTCPSYPPCDPGTEDPGSTSGGSWWGNLGDGKPNGSSSSSCAVSNGTETTAALGLVGIALGLSVARRRKGRK